MTNLLDRIAGRRVILSVSGGKDSGAASLYLTELGIDHDRVHMLTGWDSEITMDYIRGPLTAKLGPILEIRGPLLMEELIEKKGMFPSRQRRFCTEELKVFPMQRYIAARVDAGEDVINAVGIRRAESKARSKMAEWEWSAGFDCEVWRPLIDWTTDDVIAIHQRHGLAPNPLYLKGARRVGCWPCIMASKGEIKTIADSDPAQIDRLRSLEGRVSEKALVRRSARLALYQEGGVEALDVRARKALLDDAGNVKPFSRPTWFQSPLKAEGGACWPIDRVVTWSRTARGASVEDKQVELFAGMNDGCMSWGMCETEEAE